MKTTYFPGTEPNQPNPEKRNFFASKKVIAVSYAAIITIMTLFPPYDFKVYDGRSPLSIKQEYGFIFSPPKYNDQAFLVVDATKLFVQYVGVTLVFGALLVAFKGD